MSEEKVAARLDGLDPDTMRQVEIDGRDVLLVRRGDDVTALGARCTHYGAPLAEGVLHDGRITCPWHHAVFDAATGLNLEPPGCDGLRRFPCQVEDGAIRVELTEGDDRVVPEMARRNPADARTLVIVGAGAAGASAAEELRAAGFGGRVVMIGREDRLPYDRTMLSKEVLQEAELPTPLELRPRAFWESIDVELWLGREVTRVDPKAREIAFADGPTLTYDACLLATGGRPRPLTVPGADLAGVLTLRSREDIERILAALPETKAAVVVGSSFIAMECTASLRQRGIAVTVATPEPIPFAKLFGDTVGRALRDVHANDGVAFRTERKVVRFEGDGQLEAAVLDDGERLPADLAIIGVGIEPVTDFLAGVEREKDGGLKVDASMRVTEGLWAAGDIAHFPLPATGASTRIEHWRLACEHGRVAARAMLGEDVSYQGTPFFWSAQHLALYYVGHAASAEEVLLDGRPGDGPFIAYYVEGDLVTAALGAERNADMAAIQELLRLKRMPTPVELREAIAAGPFDAVARLGRASA